MPKSVERKTFKGLFQANCIVFVVAAGAKFHQIWKWQPCNKKVRISRIWQRQNQQQPWKTHLVQNFTCSQSAEYPFAPSAGQDAFWKPKGLFPLLCPVQMRTVFGRASTATEVFASDIVSEKHVAQLSLTLSLPNVAENDTFTVG